MLSAIERFTTKENQSIERTARNLIGYGIDTKMQEEFLRERNDWKHWRGTMLKEFDSSYCPYCGGSELESRLVYESKFTRVFMVFCEDCCLALDRIEEIKDSLDSLPRCYLR